MGAHHLDDDGLVATLRRTGRTLPGARRDLGPDVVRRLRSTPRRSVRSGMIAVAVGASLLLAAAAVDVLAPGVNLGPGPQAARPPEAPLVADADFLGAPVTLAEARERAGFRVRVPTLPRLGPPQVHMAGRAPGTRVSLLYGASAQMPAMAGTPVALFVTQFRGDVDPDLLTKVAGDDQVTAVDVDGDRGWWIEGVHEVLYVAPGGAVTAEPSRFARNTLLWSRGGVTLRLESAAPRDQAIAVARSMAR